MDELDWCYSGFNSRAREGRDSQPSSKSAARRVSIHAPARGATEQVKWLVATIPFQFTRPRGARPYGIQRKIQQTRFNSRAREGRDVLCRADADGFGVSIHAPARGATIDTIAVRHITFVSIHAPARGATLKDSSASTETRSFNSRAREGRDNCYTD